MTKIIAFANHKGGVGKTTSVASIGAALARKGKRTLLVDLDAQQNLTFSLMDDEAEIEASVYEALTGKVSTLPVVSIKKNLDLTPSSLDLALAEAELSPKMAREFLLKNLLEPVASNYDFVLLDCPPSLGVLTTNALTAATDLFIPLTAEALPLKGLDMLDGFVTSIRQTLNRDLQVSGVFVTRYNNRNLNNAVLDVVQTKYGSKVFATKVRENIAIAESPLHGTDVYEYAPSSNGAKDYEALTEEILKRWTN